MGSSVVQHGWVGTQSGFYVAGEISGSVRTVEHGSEPRVRPHAPGGAVGRRRRCDWDRDHDGSLGDAGNLELVVFGTAVRDSTLPAHPSGRLGMCTLSGQDVDKLRRIGAEVRDVVGTQRSYPCSSA